MMRAGIYEADFISSGRSSDRGRGGRAGVRFELLGNGRDIRRGRAEAEGNLGEFAHAACGQTEMFGSIQV